MRGLFVAAPVALATIAAVAALDACATTSSSPGVDVADGSVLTGDAAVDALGAGDGAAPSEGGASDAGADGFAQGDADAGPPATPTLIELTGTTGWQIFPGGGYRYGPSILVEDDGTTHMWTCSPGANGAWDYVRYRKSTDGAHTWTPDVVALQPTAGTRDAFSACDPGAIKIGAYFYVGYTSTEDSRGTNNQLYVARATAAEGPYEKWNGTGWGGAPQPIVTYAGDASKYGIGEPSLVVALGKLWVFHSYVDANGYTDVAVADDPTLPDWPAHLVRKGHVITRRANAEDSTDLKWVDALGRFVGVTTVDRFGPNATIGVYQSYDGLAFEPAPFKGARVQQGAHNAGISGNLTGHVDGKHPTFIAYAYQPATSSWGDWPTFVDPVALSTVPYGATVGGAVSSIVDWNWSGPKLWDGDGQTLFSSVAHGATDVATETAAVDLGSSRTIAGVTITPRGAGYGFPVDFALETSDDGATWTAVPGEGHTAFANPGSTPVMRTFAAPVKARWLRLVATKLGADDNGGHYLQLAELTPLAN